MATRAQVWLYVGLLETWLGEKVDKHQFVLHSTSSAPTFGTGHGDVNVSGLFVQRLLITKLSQIFHEARDETDLDTDSLESSFITKLDYFVS
jgi:hypothetical protein